MVAPASPFLSRLDRIALAMLREEYRAALAIIAARIDALDAAEDRRAELQARAAHARQARARLRAERQARQALHCQRMREAKLARAAGRRGRENPVEHQPAQAQKDSQGRKNGPLAQAQIAVEGIGQALNLAPDPLGKPV
jgi:hypothetical protein